MLEAAFDDVFEFKFQDVLNAEFAIIVTMIVSAVLLAALIASVITARAVLKKRGASPITSRDIAFGGVCLALSFVLGVVGLRLPQGGTVTLASSLPIMIFCYYSGFTKGFAVVLANLFLQLVANPYIVHPMSAVLDYVIPYLALIFFGIFKYRGENRENGRGSADGGSGGKYSLANHAGFFIAAALYIVVRYPSHVLSGVIFFSEWAWDGWAVLPYALVYNSFILADAAIALIGGAFVLSSQTFNRFMAAPRNALQNADAAHKNDERG